MTGKLEQTATVGFDRRQIMVGLMAGAGALLWGGLARGDEAGVKAAIAELFGGRQAMEGKVSLDLPEIAENGNTVPVEVSVESPMTANDYVKSVHLFADGNPFPEVATFHFTAKSGRAQAATRMRLAKTQNVLAVAELSDGSIYMASKEVKVTIGGCGG